MTPTAPETGNLLEYNAEYRVLICRECKYAIQKSAFGSHLLRHKVYRRERQRLLSAIARLDILEPDDVQLPSLGSPPVDGLPIIEGFKCTAAGCENLCASSKRMRIHWSERHGEPNPSVPFSRSALLQTFFRGTKLRYFEVRSVSSGDDTARTSPPVTEDRIEAVGLLPRQPVHPHTSALDLETLRYFHQFTTVTSPTLPPTPDFSSTYWQADVAAEALQTSWLMSGVLAVSATHLGTLSDDAATRRAHLHRSAHFSQEFLAGWEEAKPESCAVPVEGAKAGAQVACILRCCQWLAEASGAAVSLAATAPFQLPLFISTIRGCSDPDFALHSEISGQDTPEEAPDLDVADWGRGSNSSADSGAGAAPPALLQRLRSLPSRMLGPIGKPDSVLDFFATVAAIDKLVECCSLSYASDDMGSVWTGMESWLSRVPAHFRQMVRRRCPAALVVLAHWSLLVKRAEGCFWFLKGSTSNARRQCALELPVDEGIQDLINDMDSGD